MIWIIIFSYLAFTTQYSKIMSSSQLNQPLSGSLLASYPCVEPFPMVQVGLKFTYTTYVQIKFYERDRSCGGRSFDT